MTMLTEVQGRVVPLNRADVDTDQIMPKQFLKRVERDGFGEFVFFDWRQDPTFVLNDVRYAGATILATRENFGAGSSREHAVWGLQQYGFKAIVAPSFADIFAANAVRCGLVLVEMEHSECLRIIHAAEEDPTTTVRVDLIGRTVTALGRTTPLLIDEAWRLMLIEGRDAIARTLDREPEIAAYESRRPAWAVEVPPAYSMDKEWT